MPFTKGFSFPELMVPGKSYEHNSFERYKGRSFNREEHFSELYSCLLQEIPTVLSFDYFISVLWSDESKSNCFDLFGYNLDDKKNWKSNAGSVSWIIENGIWKKPTGLEENTCEEGQILLGEELKLRRTTRSKEEYFSKIVNLDGLNESLKFY